MKSILDDSVIELPCPHCGAKLKERIGKLKNNPKLTCAKCAGAIEISADQLMASIQKIDKSIADFQRTIGRIGK